MKYSKKALSLIAASSISLIASCGVGFTSIADQQVRVNTGEIKPIWVTGKSHLMNSVDGVQVDMNFSNLSDKTIKYVTFYTLPFNPVGDVILSEIGEKSLAELEYTGPLESGGFTMASWENVWYNS